MGTKVLAARLIWAEPCPLGSARRAAVRDLRARWAMAATSSRFDLDDSALSRAKEVLGRVKKELDVAQRVIEDDLYHQQGITGELPAGIDVVKEIDTFFAEASCVAPVGPAKLEPRAVAPTVVEVR